MKYAGTQLKMVVGRTGLGLARKRVAHYGYEVGKNVTRYDTTARGMDPILKCSIRPDKMQSGLDMGRTRSGPRPEVRPKAIFKDNYKKSLRGKYCEITDIFQVSRPRLHYSVQYKKTWLTRDNFNLLMVLNIFQKHLLLIKPLDLIYTCMWCSWQKVVTNL